MVLTVQKDNLTVDITPSEGFDPTKPTTVKVSGMFGADSFIEGSYIGRKGKEFRAEQTPDYDSNLDDRFARILTGQGLAEKVAEAVKASGQEVEYRKVLPDLLLPHVNNC